MSCVPVAWAQSTTGRSETLVVTGTRTPTRIEQALAETTVIDRDQIEQSTGRTLAELLGRQSGLQFWANGGAGKASALSIRGLESRHTLLLIDGVRYGSATLGTPAWENIPLDSIDRIEIVRGPMSGLYGSDAVGGVVQVFTRAGAPGVAMNAAAMAGSHHTTKLAGGGRFGAGDFDGAVQLSADRTRGFSATNEQVPFGSFNPDDDGFSQRSATLRLGWRVAGDWRVDANLLKATGESQFDDGPGADAKAGLRTEVLGLQAAGPVTAGWRTSLRASRATDESETLASASPFNTLGTTASVQKQLTWENTFDTPLGTAVLLAEYLRQQVSRPGTAFVLSDRTIQGVAAGLNGKQGAHTWQANLRHDRNSQFGKQTTGSAGYGYDLTRTLRAAASYGTSFVAPSFNQLYFPGFGNPLLLPEEGRHKEISLRWADEGQQLRAAYFDNRIRGYISSGPAPTNIPFIRTEGITLSYEATLGDWSVTAAADHVNARNDTAGTANAGKKLPRRNSDSLKVAVDWSAGDWRVGSSWAAVDPRFENAANTTVLGGFATWDLHARWSLTRQWSLALQLNNVANKVYQTVYGYNQPGREGFVTLHWNGL